MLALFLRFFRWLRPSRVRVLRFSEPVHILRRDRDEPLCRQKTILPIVHGGPVTATCKTCIIVAWQLGLQDNLTPEAKDAFMRRVDEILSVKSVKL